MRVRITSTNRPSMPSYRPQANTSRSPAAYRAAASWVKGPPLGAGATSLGAPSGTISSSASPQTSGFITIPGPPPNGTSSTVWWTSLAQRRRSCTPNSRSPRAAALPISEVPSGPAKYSGKIVTISMRSATPSPSSPGAPGPCPLLSSVSFFIRNEPWFAHRSACFLPEGEPHGYAARRLGPSFLGLGGVEQAARRVDDDPPAADVDLGHDLLHERHKELADWVPGAAHHEQVLAIVQHVGDLADGVAGDSAHGQPDQLVIAEL